MPYKDPEARAAYQRSYQSKYQPQYAADHADEVRQRRAVWYQQNKNRLRLKQRQNYRAKKSTVAVATLQHLSTK